ncbi:MAG: rhodanese-like domain-containing protein [Velocimicrobium sp.]
MILDNAINKNRTLITANELKIRMESGEAYELIDARVPSQYAQDHIKTAKNIPHDKLREALKNIDKDVPIITYCNKGVTGNAVQNILLNHGCREVYNLSGGHKNYKKRKEVLS